MKTLNKLANSREDFLTTMHLVKVLYLYTL